MEIADKIVIADKQSATIPLKNLVGTLSWKTPVDLDLHCFYETKTGQQGHIYFRNRGDLANFPFIALDRDMGIGNKVDTADGNEENIRFGDLSNIKHLLICSNIFNVQGGKWKQHGASVTIKADSKGFEVPLTADFPGSWCVIAHVDNTSPMGAELKNVNKIFGREPRLSDIANNFSDAVTGGSSGSSFFGRLFS